MKPNIQAGRSQLLTATDPCAIAIHVRNSRGGSNRILDEPEIRRTPKEMTGTVWKVQPANQEQQLKMEGVLHIPNCG